MAYQMLRAFSAESRIISDLSMYSGQYGTTNPSISSTDAFTGTYSYKQASNVNGYAFGHAPINSHAAKISFMIRHSAVVGNSTDWMPIVIFNVGGVHVDIYWRNNGLIGIRAGYVFDTTNVRYPVTEVSSAPLQPTNTWHHVAATARFAETDGFLSLYVNGQQVITWTGDTRIYTSNLPGGVTPPPLTNIEGLYAVGGGYILGIDPISWGTSYVDDIAIYAGNGSEADAPVRNVRFMPMFPTGPGTYTQMTPNANTNWQQVSETPPDGDTSFVKAAGAGLRDTYQFNAITVPEDYAVRAVIVMPYAEKTDGGVDASLKTIIHNDDGEILSDALPLASSYGYVMSRSEVQPNGAAWTEEAVNAAEYGQESAGTFA